MKAGPSQRHGMNLTAVIKKYAFEQISSICKSDKEISQNYIAIATDEILDCNVDSKKNVILEVLMTQFNKTV